MLRRETSKQHSFSMQDFCLQKMLDVLKNWQSADVRTVPDVMYQVRCDSDENDPTISYQFNWFLDCAETHIHNHQNSFYTYCLEGQYEEKIWHIVDNHDGNVTYKFSRNPDNTLTAGRPIPGTLHHVASRYHFPGNQMHVDTEHVHSITPVAGSSERVLTFLIKKKYSVPIDTFVLSSESDFHLQMNEMRSATDDERDAMFEKLVEVLANSDNAQWTELIDSESFNATDF